ncbi:hypothetical protein PQX77_005967 [Marasmius sp. AFHP31]|nr:hypothetical protein PQX77_005967 [Marasmius sp. AFHP31]
MSTQEARTFSASCDQLTAVLQRFNAELRSPSSASSTQTQRRLLVIYLLSQVAIIQLHSAFAWKSADSRRQVLTAAEAIVKCMRSVGLQHYNGFIDPVVAILLKIVGNVFITELSSPSPIIDPRRLASSCETVIQAMTILGGTGMFLNADDIHRSDSQAQALQQRYNALRGRS